MLYSLARVASATLPVMAVLYETTTRLAEEAIANWRTASTTTMPSRIEAAAAARPATQTVPAINTTPDTTLLQWLLPFVSGHLPPYNWCSRIRDTLCPVRDYIRSEVSTDSIRCVDRLLGNPAADSTILSRPRSKDIVARVFFLSGL